MNEEEIIIFTACANAIYKEIHNIKKLRMNRCMLLFIRSEELIENIFARISKKGLDKHLHYVSFNHKFLMKYGKKSNNSLANISDFLSKYLYDYENFLESLHIYEQKISKNNYKMKYLKDNRYISNILKKCYSMSKS